MCVLSPDKTSFVDVAYIGYEKILVAGGGSTSVEIVDIETKTTTCDDLAPLPFSGILK